MLNNTTCIAASQPIRCVLSSFAIVLLGHIAYRIVGGQHYIACRYTRLAVVPDNTPLPMTMLRKLWQLASEREAEECCYMLQQLSILRVAQLYDGSAWALVDATHLKHLQVYVTRV